MEKIIEKYDYLHATDEMEVKLRDELANSAERFAQGLTLNGVKNIISVFVKKVCIRPFPHRNSPGFYMCSMTLSNIITVMKACKSEHKTLTKVECQNLLFDLLLDFISKGQGSTHFDLIKDIWKVLSMTVYIEKLRGEELRRLLDAIKQQEYIEEPDIEIKEYAGSYERAIGRIIEISLGENDQEKHREADVHSQFLDLYIYFMVQMTKNPEALVEKLRNCQMKIWHKYKRDPYGGVTDVDLYRRHLVIIKSVLSDEIFPRINREMDSAKDVVQYFLKAAMKETSVIKAIWTDLTDLYTSLAVSPRAEDLIPVLEKFDILFKIIAEETIQSDGSLFEIWAPKIAEMLNKSQNKDVMDAIAPRQVDELLNKIKPVSGHDKYWIPILKGLLRHPTYSIANAAKDVIEEKKLRKIWNWKNNVEGAKQIIITARDANYPTVEGPRVRNNENTLEKYGRLIKELIQQLQLVKISHLVMPELASFLISALEKRSVIVNKMAEECSDMLDLTENTEVIPDFLRRFCVLYYDTAYPWSEGWSMHVGSEVLDAVVEAYKGGKEVQPEVNNMLIGILDYAMDDNTERIDFESRSASMYGLVFLRLLVSFVNVHCDGGTAEMLAPLVPGIFKMMEDDNEQTTMIANAAFQIISVKAPTLIAVQDDFDRLIQRYVDTGDSTVLASLYQLYSHNTEAMGKRFQDVMSTLGKNKDNTSMLFVLLSQISEKQPEIFTRENVNALSEYLDDSVVQIQVLMILDKIVIKNPDIILDQVDKIMQNKKIPVTGTHFIQGILSAVAVKHKKYLDPVLEFLIERSKSDQEQMILSVYAGMRKLADYYGSEPFIPYRKYLDELKMNKSSYTKDAVTSLIDVLENRSLETVATDVKQVKDDVNELDERVTGTEIVVGGVVQQVERHEGEIKDVQEGVAVVNQRVDEVEEDLGEVKEKVEEIDMKTMSNAPTWSRDVTKLMNPESDHDWRLLASRLGYTNDDIRAWATQSDPCMALLSEWYATHKTREATNGVLNVLQEMNRLDAAVIVENAMKVAEDVVEDEDFEYPSPPPVFLSYQWGHQNEVKLLRQHLQMAGYECWMDVGQMGGGDKLFEKIDAGIRGAKVVICCVSEKYAKSPNCNREVNLAVNLRKPMIPLQMEKIAWPPVGSMGPIFSEYLYIRFYSGGDSGGKYWVDTKFQELLMQLQFNNVVPDEKLITAEYKNWWIPVAEEIIVEKKDNKDAGKTAKSEKKDTDTGEVKEEAPEVFLSYQWSKQKQIQALYQRLTGLGLRCWMDIHQMGGGDSLYDKIDRGVRGCKVVLSSVTPKYALSANCRREVSLADALKKPIIPLLLEDIDWPPSGPMSMVFTQLLYINFCKDPDVQMKWTGKEFDELLDKLKKHIPALTNNGNKTPTSQIEEKTASQDYENKTVEGKGINSKTIPVKQDVDHSKSATIAQKSTDVKMSNPSLNQQTNAQSLKSHGSVEHQSQSKNVDNRRDSEIQNKNTSKSKKSSTCLIL